MDSPPKMLKGMQRIKRGMTPRLPMGIRPGTGMGTKVPRMQGLLTVRHTMATERRPERNLRGRNLHTAVAAEAIAEIRPAERYSLSKPLAKGFFAGGFLGLFLVKRPCIIGLRHTGGDEPHVSGVSRGDRSLFSGVAFS